MVGTTPVAGVNQIVYHDKYCRYDCDDMPAATSAVRPVQGREIIMKTGYKYVLAAVAMAAAAFTGTGALAAEATKIAFLMPCTQCADRWETKDRPFFIAAVNELDPSIEVIALNAEGDGNRQIAQGESVLAQVSRQSSSTQSVRPPRFRSSARHSAKACRHRI